LNKHIAFIYLFINLLDKFLHDNLWQHLFKGYALAQSNKTTKQGAALFIADFELL
jgi:hypothetical protein